MFWHDSDRFWQVSMWVSVFFCQFLKIQKEDTSCWLQMVLIAQNLINMNRKWTITFWVFSCLQCVESDHSSDLLLPADSYKGEAVRLVSGWTWTWPCKTYMDIAVVVYRARVTLALTTLWKQKKLKRKLPISYIGNDIFFPLFLYLLCLVGIQNSPLTVIQLFLMKITLLCCLRHGLVDKTIFYAGMKTCV